jgi:hypothetical protein
MDYVVRPIEWREPRFNIHMKWAPTTDDELRDQYYLGNLTQGYLVGKHLVWVGEDPADIAPAEAGSKKPPRQGQIGRFADGTVSKMSSAGHWTVIDNGVLTVDGDYRAVPRGDSEIVLYSVEARRAEVNIPARWAGRKLVLVEVEDPGRLTPVKPAPGASAVTIELRPRTAYLLRAGK